MGTYYIVDTRSYFNASHMEYVQNDDKVHLILRGIPKTGEKADFINNKYIQNNITYSVIKGFSDDTVDFTLVPMICEIINKVKDMQVVVISRNFKLFCLTSYYKNQFGYNLEIADSIKDYNSIKYIQKAVNIPYEEALNVFRGFVKYRTCKAKGVSSATRRKIEKDIEVYRNIIEITNIDFDEVLQDNSILLISGNNKGINTLRKCLEDGTHNNRNCGKWER